MGCWLGLRALKTLYFHLCKVIYKKSERIFVKNFSRNYEKNNTWNIRHLFNETILPLHYIHHNIYYFHVKKCNDVSLENQTKIDLRKDLTFASINPCLLPNLNLFQNFSSWVSGFDDFAPVCEINYSDFNLWTDIVST